MAREVFDVENIVFMIDGVEVSDALDGEVVTVERVGEVKKARYALKGKPLVTKNPQAKHATVKFALLKDHAINMILQSKDTFAISLMDMNTKISYTSSVAHVMKEPSDSFGKDEQGEYEVLAEYMKKDMIGSV